MITAETIAAAPGRAGFGLVAVGSEWLTSGVWLARVPGHLLALSTNRKDYLEAQISRWERLPRNSVNFTRRNIPWTDHDGTKQLAREYKGDDVTTSVDERCAALLHGLRVFRCGHGPEDMLVGADRKGRAMVFVMPVRL